MPAEASTGLRKVSRGAGRAPLVFTKIRSSLLPYRDTFLRPAEAGLKKVPRHDWRIYLVASRSSGPALHHLWEVKPVDTQFTDRECGPIHNFGFTCQPRKVTLIQEVVQPYIKFLPYALNFSHKMQSDCTLQ